MKVIVACPLESESASEITLRIPKFLVSIGELQDYLVSKLNLKNKCWVLTIADYELPFEDEIELALLDNNRLVLREKAVRIVDVIKGNPLEEEETSQSEEEKQEEKRENSHGKKSIGTKGRSSQSHGCLNGMKTKEKMGNDREEGAVSAIEEEKANKSQKRKEKARKTALKILSQFKKVKKASNDFHQLEEKAGNGRASRKNTRESCENKNAGSHSSSDGSKLCSDGQSLSSFLSKFSSGSCSSDSSRLSDLLPPMHWLDQKPRGTRQAGAIVNKKSYSMVVSLKKKVKISSVYPQEKLESIEVIKKSRRTKPIKSKWPKEESPRAQKYQQPSQKVKKNQEPLEYA